MKNIVSFLTIALLFYNPEAKAQIPNSGFELTNSFGSISNWGINFVTSIWFDSLGVGHTDSVVIDNQLYFQTTDAHSGTYAMEMRNGYNFTAATGITGGAFLSDTDYTFFNIPISVQNQPTDLNFYYKYFPAGPDTVLAYLALFDSLGNQIGECSIVIGGATSNYILATAPIVYSMPGTAATLSMYFKTQLDFAQPTFGTRFLVDDVSLTGTSGTLETNTFDLVSIYPNPSNGRFTVFNETTNSDELITVTNVLGLIVFRAKSQKSKTMIDLSGQPDGMYIVEVSNENARVTKRISINK